MLTVLLHSDLGDVVAVVSRWFGGVKLGTGGLVRAYSASVQEALLTLPRREHREYVVIDVIVAYAQISACQQLWPPFEASVLADRYDADVRFTVRCPLETEQALRQALLDATRGQAVITRRALLE